MSVNLRNELRQRYGTRTDVQTPEVASGGPGSVSGGSGGESLDRERAFVVTGNSGRTVITAPVTAMAADKAAREGFSYLSGRLVGADRPNDNGAMWSSGDLELANATVAGGPLNWLHQERTIIGALLESTFNGGRESADDSDAHIGTSAVMWDFLYPREVAAVKSASASGQLFLSMECLSRQVECVSGFGREGCGEKFEYAAYDSGDCCSHLRERSSVRRFVDPTFYGAAVVVPPVRPGWSEARATVESAEELKRAAAAAETTQLDEVMSDSQAAAMVAHVIQWANR